MIQAVTDLVSSCFKEKCFVLAVTLSYCNDLDSGWIVVDLVAQWLEHLPCGWGNTG